MQIKIKINGQWWLMPIKGEFTEKELAPYLVLPGVEVLKMGETVRFFDVKKKKEVLSLLNRIAAQHSAHPTKGSRPAKKALSKPKHLSHQKGLS